MENMNLKQTRERLRTLKKRNEKIAKIKEVTKNKEEEKFKRARKIQEKITKEINILKLQEKEAVEENLKKKYPGNWEKTYGRSSRELEENDRNKISNLEDDIYEIKKSKTFGEQKKSEDEMEKMIKEKENEIEEIKGINWNLGEERINKIKKEIQELHDKAMDIKGLRSRVLQKWQKEEIGKLNLKIYKLNKELGRKKYFQDDECV